MEVVLDLYTQQHSESEPLICMDEAAMQLTGHVFEPIPLAPGQDTKEDYHYTREGVQALFMFFDPIEVGEESAIAIIALVSIGLKKYVSY